MPRVVKRYANRKLYDTTTSRYVALDDIATMVRAGEDVEVTDNESGEDLTAVTLAQILLEEERRKKNLLSLPLLRELVRYGDKIAGMTNRGIEALEEMRERAEQTVTDIVGDPPALIDEVVSSSRQRIEDLQTRIDDGVKQSVDRLRAAGIGMELERLESGLKDLETHVRSLIAGEEETAGEEERAKDSSPAPSATYAGASEGEIPPPAQHAASSGSERH